MSTPSPTPPNGWPLGITPNGGSSMTSPGCVPTISHQDDEPSPPTASNTSAMRLTATMGVKSAFARGREDGSDIRAPAVR
jgi:hypothetical protein